MFRVLIQRSHLLVLNMIVIFGVSSASPYGPVLPEQGPDIHQSVAAPTTTAGPLDQNTEQEAEQARIDRKDKPLTIDFNRIGQTVPASAQEAIRTLLAESIDELPDDTAFVMTSYRATYDWHEIILVPQYVIDPHGWDR